MCLKVMAGGYNLRNAGNGNGEAGNVEGNGAGNPNLVQVDVGAMMNQILQAVQNNPWGNHGDPFARRNIDFTSLGGKPFNGEGTALVADAWLQKCEFVFERMQLTEIQKQELAAHQLEGAGLSS